tara:strand:- start:12406 stop:12675 length:270 start_codon:yes stop_codon:yes gene_type:complete
MDLNSIRPNYFFRGLYVRRDDGVIGTVATEHAYGDADTVDVSWEESGQSVPCKTSRLTVNTETFMGKLWALQFAAALKSAGGSRVRATA